MNILEMNFVCMSNFVTYLRFLSLFQKISGRDLVENWIQIKMVQLKRNIYFYWSGEGITRIPTLHNPALMGQGAFSPFAMGQYFLDL